MEQTIRTNINRIEKIRNTRNGNARYRVYCANGMVYNTKPDSSMTEHFKNDYLGGFSDLDRDGMTEPVIFTVRAGVIIDYRVPEITR